MSTYTKQVMPAKLRLPIKILLIPMVVCSLLLCMSPFIRFPTKRAQLLDIVHEDLEGNGTSQSPLTVRPQQCIGVELLRAACRSYVREAADLDLVSR